MGFFDLPRELRDAVYDLALEHDRASTQLRGTMSLHVRAPEPRLRLISRQFASEYYERSPSKDDICLSVTGSSLIRIPPSASGFTFAARASTVDATLTFDEYDDSMYNYIDPLSTWLFELVKDMSCIKTLHLQLCFNIPRHPKAIDWFSRTAHRGIPYIPEKLSLLQQETRDTKPIISLDKVDVMVVMPRLNSENANSAGSQLGKVGTWTRAGYQVDADLAEVRRKYGGS